MSALDVKDDQQQNAGGVGGSAGEPTGNQPDYEALARPEGWKPKDEYRGNPDEWVDAETFVRRGREINPILRKNNARLQQELATLRAELSEASSAVKSLQEYNSKLEEKAYQRALQSLKAEKRQALAAGDHETAAELEDQLDELRENPPKQPAPAPASNAPKVDPVFQSWQSENASWFNDENPDMVDYANAVGMRLRRQDPQMTRFKGQAFLDEIKKAVEKQFPDKFGRRAGGPAMVEGSGGPSASQNPNGKTTLASLPADAQREYRSMAKEKWYQDLAKSQNLTTEQMFIRDYGDTP